MRKKPIQPKRSGKVYVLEVFLIGGPIPKKFEGKVISRKIQIRGRQTLKDLHRVIFKAFDRFDKHFYEFNFGKGPYDRSNIYSICVKGLEWDGSEGDVAKTTIDSLNLEVGRAFGYRFDFGDEWFHQINVVSVKHSRGSGRYPRIVERKGESPPQYPEAIE